MTTVFHLPTAREDRVNRAFNNIENTLAADGVDANLGDGAQEVICVATGPAVAILKAGSRFSDRIAELQQQGARFEACENSIKEAVFTSEDLVDGVGTVSSGVVAIRDHQHQGAAYIRP